MNTQVYCGADLTFHVMSLKTIYEQKFLTMIEIRTNIIIITLELIRKRIIISNQ